MGYRDYSTAKGRIVDSTGHGDFTTIQAAINAASSGQTVFVRPGTYTENITHKAGVNVTAFVGDAENFSVNVVGKWTISGPGTFALSSLTLTTNSDFCISMGGSDATILHVEDCLIIASNNTAVQYTTANPASVLVIYNSVVAVDSSQACYSMSSTGTLSFYENQLVGATTVASNSSAGAVLFFTCQMGWPISSSGNSGLLFGNCRNDCALQNSTCLTITGTGTAKFNNGEMLSGTASAVSIGTGTLAIITQTNLESSNTNVLTGAGELRYAFISFSGASSGHNVTTETALNTLI